MHGESRAPSGSFALGSAIGALLWILWSVPALMFAGISGEQVGTVFGIAVIGLVVGILTATGLDAVALCLASHRIRPILLIIWAIGGACAGGVLAWLSNLAGFPPTYPYWSLILVPAVATPWIVDAVHQVSAVRRRVLDDREHLIDEAAQLMATTVTQQSLISEVRSTITGAVNAELEPARHEVARHLAVLKETNETLTSGSGAIRSAAHDSVRPLAAMLHSSHVARPEPIGVWGTIQAIIKTQPFHPLPLAVIYVVVNLPNLSQQRGGSQAIFDVIVGVLLIFGILSGGNLLMRRDQWRHDVVFISTFIVLQVPTALFLTLTAEPGFAPVVNIAASVIVSFLLVVLTSSLGSWRQRQETAQETFRDLLTDERIASLAQTRVAADIARQAAQTLHGPVQARLAACAVAMEQAADVGDLDLYRQSLEQAQAALESPLFPDTEQPTCTIEEAVRHAAGPWRTLLEISTEIAPDDAGDLDPQGLIQKVVEEAIANASRHGYAKHIHIRVHRDGAATLVEVHDDGRGVHDHRPGLGSRLYDQCTNGQWTLTTGSQLDGGLLRATIAPHVTPLM